jgi:hypothetical protein
MSRREAWEQRLIRPGDLVPGDCVVLRTMSEIGAAPEHCVVRAVLPKVIAKRSLDKVEAIHGARIRAWREGLDERWLLLNVDVVGRTGFLLDSYGKNNPKVPEGLEAPDTSLWLARRREAYVPTWVGTPTYGYILDRHLPDDPDEDDCFGCEPPCEGCLR